MYKRILILLIAVVLTQLLHGVWRTSTPETLTQPDGTEIQAFQSGDEFHHWVHDSEGYTIALDYYTDYWCWALLENDKLVSSGHPIHLTNPQTLGIQPFTNISEERYQQKRQSRLEPLYRDHTRTPSTGEVNNLVIMVRFSDQNEFTMQFSAVNNRFNGEGTNVNSLRQYYIDASYDQLYVNSPIFPLPNGNAVVSVVDSHPRGYFLAQSSSNPNGYPNENEGSLRIRTMLAAAVSAVGSSNQVPTDINLDADNNGRIDNIVFIVRGNAAGWSDALWSHRSALNTNSSINGKRAYDYNMVMENHFSDTGTIVHEYGHSLGAPDLYRYSGNTSFAPVGIWDVMGGTTDPPQSMSAYIKEQYMYWTYIPYATASGEYTINPVTTSQEDHAVKIVTPYSTTQYFIAEYRRKITGQIDGNLPGSGLLVYRVLTTQQNGSMYGPPDELYLYRPNGTLSANGNITNAYFVAPNRTQINDSTNPNSFIYANAAGTTTTAGGLNIYDIGMAGDTITFTVSIQNAPTNLTYSVIENQVTLNWTPPSQFTPTGYKIFRNGTYITGSLTTNRTYTDTVTTSGDYTYTVVAYYADQYGDSAPSNAVVVNVVSETDHTTEPFTTQLLPNYPNPFNPSTNINFYLKNDETVTIDIYNLKGQNIKTLSPGVLQKGFHSIPFTADDIGSGVYFYSMKTSDYKAIRKMILLK